MLKKVALLVISCAVFGAACGASENTVSREPKTKNAALGVDASARITITATRAGSPTVSCSYAVGAATSCALPQLEGRGWSIGASLSATVGAESVQILGGGQAAVVAPTSTTSGVANTVVADGTLCNDGNAATSGDVMVDGRCVGQNIMCDDNNPLTIDAASVDSGCVYTPVADGTPCDDGDPSTSPDGAINGRCAPGTTSTTKPLPPTTIPATTTTIPPTTTTTINYSGQNLRGRNFAGAQLINANLSGANLSGAVLTGANLTGANLTGANLGGANLSNAILSRANVTRTNFTGATVLGVLSGGLGGAPALLPSGFVIRNGYLIGVGVNLGGADLAGLSLTNLRLAGANFKAANLQNANLTGSNLSNAIFIDADVRGARLPAGFDCRASGARNCP